MRRLLLASLMGFSLLAIPALVGCEREISHEREVREKDDGTRIEEEKRVTEDRQTGEITTTEEKKVDRP